IVSLVIGVYYKSIEILMYGYLVTCIISYFINYYVSRKVYRSEATYRELIYTLKVVLSMTLVIVGFYSLDTWLSLKFMYNLLYLPLFLIGYLYLLRILHVVNLKKDLNIIRTLKR
ncbi:hypothetical protein, partial [Myroides sp. LoEW2-1]|uniref:hypothetical protein n=1 Tax=Myroides sp. LoEW2-1 TaxID=2683192 RepID=UPI001AA1084C